MLDNLRLSNAAKLKDQLSANDEKFQTDMLEVASRNVAAEERIKEAAGKTLSLAEQFGLKMHRLRLSMHESETLKKLLKMISNDCFSGMRVICLLRMTKLRNLKRSKVRE